MDDIKNWLNERSILKNEIIADELYVYLKDRLKECEKFNGRVTHEVIVSLVGSYGFILLFDQGMLERCDYSGVYRLVERKED